jgi:NAD(P)H-dependent FMN reductase
MRPEAVGTPLNLPVLVGTMRRAAHSTGVGRFVHRRGTLRPGITSTLHLSPESPFANFVDTEWEMERPPPAVVEFTSAMAAADGFVIVTPEYNYGLPGTLKNLLDAVYDEWGRKPFAFVGVSSGGVGGARALEQLRSVVAGVKGLALPYQVLVRQVQESFRDDVPIVDVEAITQKIDRLWEELEWYARALRDARPSAPR